MMMNTIWDLNKVSLYATEILVCKCMFCHPKMHFSVRTKPSNTSQETPMMKGNQRGRLVNHLVGHLLMQTSVPTYRGTENAGELKGIYGKTLVLLSRFAQLPRTTILQDILSKMDVSASIVTPPTLTFPNPDMMLANVTKADVDSVLG